MGKLDYNNRQGYMPNEWQTLSAKWILRIIDSFQKVQGEVNSKFIRKP